MVGEEATELSYNGSGTSLCGPVHRRRRKWPVSNTAALPACGEQLAEILTLRWGVAVTPHCPPSKFYLFYLFLFYPAR